MSTLHEAAQLALEALEYGQHSLKQISEYQWESRGQLAMDALKAALALDAALKAQAGCDTETDCTSQPWCRISGECHRKQAHPEPAQEPAAWMYPDDYAGILKNQSRAEVFQKAWCNPAVCVPLYTAPLRRPPLTDEEMRKLWSQYGYKSALCMRFARAIERKVRGE